MNVQQSLSLAMAAVLFAAPLPAGMAIGAAAGPGRFEINKRSVAGTGSVQPGDEVRTASAPSTVRLSSGTRLDLAPRSALSVFSSHANLAAGTTEVRPERGFEIEAGKLRISSESTGAKATVRHLENGRLMVSADGGNYRVRNASGVLIARVRPGQPLLFSSSAAAKSDRLVVKGLLERQRGSHFLTDETAAVRFQLEGNGLDRYQGQRVQVEGRLAARRDTNADSTQLIQVAWVAQAPAAGAAAAGSSSGSAAGAGAGAAAGTGATAGTGAAAGAGATGAATAGAATAGAATAGAATAGAATAGAVGAATATAAATGIGLTTAVVAGVAVTAATVAGVAVATGGEAPPPAFTPQTISQ